VKISKSQIHDRVQRMPELHFEDQRLTSFSGCVILQALFRKLKFVERLQGCFEHRTYRLIVGFRSVVQIVIVHLMLGYRRLRDIQLYKDDPMVLQALNLKRMPDVSTICRTLYRMDRSSLHSEDGHIGIQIKHNNMYLVFFT
jgi:hypothetical protein